MTPEPPPHRRPTPIPRRRSSASAAVTIYERSVEGRRAATLPAAPASPSRRSRRADPGAASCAPSGPALPEVSEPEIVRHYNRLSRRNFDLDTGPYPLGSCTMKHNPRLNEKVAALPGTPGCTRRRTRSAPRARWS